MTPRILMLFAVVLLTGRFPNDLHADDGAVYLKKVKPLLALRCVSCHGPLRQRGGLRLDAAVLIRKGGDSGPAVVPGKPEKSLLLHALTGTNDATRMPAEAKPLKKTEIALLRKWIADGARSPKREKIAADPRNHWAFKPPLRPQVPRPKNAGWVKNAVDAFIAAQHEKRGLSPARPAKKYVLLRRVSLDLIGLPPTPEQLRAFLSDNSPNAYERVVDELLKSPRYGERWGRHWMDVWRYSDWYGYKKELRNSARHIWRWRDWIIDSLNADRPYNDMLADMLAADELAPNDANRLRATGFLARHYYKFNRNTWLDGVIEHTGKAFLGLTFNCARCHDHMYDPISQKEYYRLRAIFEPYKVRTRRIAGQPDVMKDGIAVAYDASLSPKTFVFDRGNDKYPDKEHPVSPGIPEILNATGFKIRPVKLPPEAWYPGLRDGIQREFLNGAKSAVSAKDTALAKASKQLAAAKSPAAKNAAKAAVSLAEKELKAAELALKAVTARIAADKARYSQPPAGNVNQLAVAAGRAERVAALHRAEAAVARAEFGLNHPSSKSGKKLVKKPGKKNKVAGRRKAALKKQLVAARKQLAAAKAALKKKVSGYTPLTKTYPRVSSGRRSALARWIAGRRNPLTARVAVNHIWMRHFGKPLVPTVFDFGKNGKPATHPQLLDWLAVEFMDNNWSMKKLHRLIVTSNAYRMTSTSGAAAAANRRVDPDNRFVWRMNARRMESEIVRDSVLFVSGKLDLKTGGPELDAKSGLTTFRRSLYYRHAPEKFMTFLELFDAPSTNECYRRNETVVPQQALALFNSSLALRESRRLAVLLTRKVGTDTKPKTADAFIAALFTRVLCRPPSEVELRTCREFLAGQTRLLSNPDGLTKFAGGPTVKTGPSPKPHLRARENLAQVLLNHHEFVTSR